jgi:hypothetical protein
MARCLPRCARHEDHYAKIWDTLKETLHVERFVSDETTLAVQMWTPLEALVDAPDTIFGRLREGECLDDRGVIMYRIDDYGRFDDICVASNSLTFTNLDGRVAVPQYLSPKKRSAAARSPRFPI